jgi:Domain of unknown function (DUF305)
MKVTHSMVVMFIGSFIIQYFVMPPIMVNKFVYITNSIGKVYLATIMALCMVIIEIMMHDHQYNVLSFNWYAILISLLAIFIYLYRKQIGIRDKQYLKEMIEHHSMALFTSKEILKKTDDYNVAKVAKNIIQSQQDELEYMNYLLSRK